VTRKVFVSYNVVTLKMRFPDRRTSGGAGALKLTMSGFVFGFDLTLGDTLRTFHSHPAMKCLILAVKIAIEFADSVPDAPMQLLVRRLQIPVKSLMFVISIRSIVTLGI
jgi:hypothetical protein